MNAKKYLYDKIKERLAADCRDENNVPIVKTFELFADQINNERTEDAINYPAVYLQFASMEYKGQFQNIQHTETVLTIHICGVDLDAYNRNILDLAESVHYSLHGFEDTNKYFTPLYRIAERQVIGRDNVEVWEVDYTTLLQDLSTHRKKRLTLTELTALDLTDAPDADTKPRLRNL